VPNGLAVTVRLTPKSGADAIEGILVRDDGRPVLAMRVRAAASDGAANAAAIALLARSLGVPPRDVTLAAGQKARIKRLVVAGDPAALAARLEAVAQEG